MTGQVWFVGAGPGDPDLITVKGRRLIEQAGAILYAGSLVDVAATRYAPPGCQLADSKCMTLAEIATWLIAAARMQATVVRLQTGDPALYGALTELTRPLDAAGIGWRVVPGVTSAMAAAAAAGESLTLPEVTQTVILTRTAGRTPMPPREDLAALAAHHATLCIYLSATLLPTVQQALRAAGWSEQAPILVVQRASWGGRERIVRGRLHDIEARCRAAGIAAQAMIIASPALGAGRRSLAWSGAGAGFGAASDRAPPPSRLYDAAFAHRFRAATDPDRSRGPPDDDHRSATGS